MRSQRSWRTFLPAPKSLLAWACVRFEIERPMQFPTAGLEQDVVAVDADTRPPHQSLHRQVVPIAACYLCHDICNIAHSNADPAFASSKSLTRDNRLHRAFPITPGLANNKFQPSAALSKTPRCLLAKWPLGFFATVFDCPAIPLCFPAARLQAANTWRTFSQKQLPARRMTEPAWISPATQRSQTIARSLVWATIACQPIRKIDGCLDHTHRRCSQPNDIRCEDTRYTNQATVRR